MKRFPILHGISLTVVSLAGLALIGCGGGGGSSKKDASTDAKGDATAGLDMSTDRGADQVQANEAGPPIPDGPVADALPSPDLPSVAEPGPDANPTNVLDAEDDVPSQPDLPQGAADTAGKDDVAPSPDLPIARDVPVTVDGGQADGPTTVIVDAAAVDGAVVDSATVEASAPGVVTGWPSNVLDFGTNPCGGEAPAAKTFTLTNSGASTVTLTKAQFTGTSGYSSDAAGKTILPGKTLVVTVTAPGVPQTSAVPANYDDVLTIETDIPNDDQHLIHVTEAAQGAVLVWNTVPEFGSFGSLPPAHSTSAAFQVVNNGNVQAQLSLTTTGPFAVTSATPVTVAAGAAADGTVAFTAPNAGGAATGTLAVSLATPVALCQPLPSSLALTGTSINGALSLSAVALSFATPCGGSATAQNLTVTNAGAAAMTWSAALEAGSSSPFQIAPTGSTLTPQTGSPEPNTVVAVTPVVPVNATPLTDTIDITTDAIGDTVHKVVLTQTPLGDVVSVSGGTAIALGSVPIASPALSSQPVVLTVSNDANVNSAPAVVSFQVTGASASYFSVSPAQVTVPAGAQAQVSVTFSPGSDGSIITSGTQISLAANLHWQIGSEANCGTSSGDIATMGTATLAQISGVPAQLDFGLVNCGASGLQQQITVTNSGSAPCQVTNVAVVNPTYYTVDYPTLPNVIPAGGTMIVTVTPASIPATVNQVPDHNSYDGKLTITTDIVGDSPHAVNLLMGAQGAIIANTPWPTDWSFGTANVGETRKLYVPVINNGNVPVTATLQDVIVAAAQASVFSLANPSVLPAGQTSNIVALFQPNEAGLTFTATADLMLSVANDKVFCQPLPAGWNSTSHNIHMQGSSTGP